MKLPAVSATTSLSAKLHFRDLSFFKQAVRCGVFG